MTKEEIEFFDKISETWDREEKRSKPDKISSILSKIDIKKGFDILDLGTGTGVLIPYLADFVGNDGQICAVDISKGMLEQAISKYSHISNVEFYKKDFENEKIDGQFDVIMLYCVYPHLHTPRATLNKLIENNLKEDGRIVIAFPSDESFINNIHRERKAESDLLQDAGTLAEILREWGFQARVLAYSSEEYIVEIK